VIVRIQKLDEMAQLPKYAKHGDAGLDLVAISKNETDDYIEYGTGLAIEIPEGYVGLIFPRSSISKHDMALANSVGVIDSGYRGEIKLRFNVVRNDSIQPSLFEQLEPTKPSVIYEVSDKIGQLIILPYPHVVLQVVDDLAESARGAGGFGSSGK
jgi:dUTP pyrophosphatase